MSRINDPSMQQGEQKSMTERAQEMGQQVKSAAQEQLGQLRESASQYYEQGREKAMQWEQNVEDYIREQPVKSVLIAAGVGLLLGFIWRRS